MTRMTTTAHGGLWRYWRRGFQAVHRLPWKAALAGYCLLGIAGFFVINWVYHAVRKPVELLAPVSDSFAKTPESTLKTYGFVFEEHSTSIISPEFLAALAQVESDGNPVARTYWRWRWSWNPFNLYRPASSALGMFQFTDGTFAEARKYCIRDHEVVADGPWHDFDSCWFNSLYTRMLPSHATELTAAYLHRSVLDALATGPAQKVSAAQKRKLAAVIHLCGAGRGATFVKRKFRLEPGERCGTQSLRRYLVKIERMEKHFARLRKGVTVPDPGGKPSATSRASPKSGVNA